MWPSNFSLVKAIAQFTIHAFCAVAVSSMLVVFGGGVIALGDTSDAALHLTISPSPNEPRHTTIDATQSEVITLARVVVGNTRTQQNEDEIILLTLRANNIQVQSEWRVTNAANAFIITDGTLS